MATDDFLPSGEWTGFFQQYGLSHRTDLHLRFAAGKVTGDGADAVGPFTVRGRYDAATGELNWTKSYRGAHDVFYRGFRDGKSIWGVWEIPHFDRSGFKIWPRGAAGYGHAVATATEQAPQVTPAPTRVKQATGPR